MSRATTIASSHQPLLVGLALVATCAGLALPSAWAQVPAPSPGQSVTVSRPFPIGNYRSVQASDVVIAMQFTAGSADNVTGTFRIYWHPGRPRPAGNQPTEGTYRFDGSQVRLRGNDGNTVVAQWRWDHGRLRIQWTLVSALLERSPTAVCASGGDCEGGESQVAACRSEADLLWTCDARHVCRAQCRQSSVRRSQNQR